MNLIYFKSHTFLAREIENVLTRRTDFKTTVVTIPECIADGSAQDVFDQIKSMLPAIILSVNNAGYDFKGELSDLIAESGSYQVNWDVDDPFYHNIIYGSRTPNLHNRLDFVTEASFVPLMNRAGYNAHFLPLGVDPAYFNTQGPSEYSFDISFVGNSSLEFLDSLVSEEVQKELEKVSTLIGQLKDMYYSNPRIDLREYLLNNSQDWRGKIEIPEDKFLFIIIWLIGFFYRRDFITQISGRYKERFICLGDPYWSKYITTSKVSADARYYDNLCSYFRSTKINLNINRIQIRTSFTNRIFDCKASGAFVLTEKRDLNEKFFTTRGTGREIVEFRSLSECMELIDYYLKHDDEREKIARAGIDKVLQLHTYDQRFTHMIQVCKEQWGI